MQGRSVEDVMVEYIQFGEANLYEEMKKKNVW